MLNNNRKRNENIEINECSTSIRNQPENFDELYQKYENLKKERNRLLQLSEE